MHGASIGVLTDRRFAGADALATAYTLSCGVRKLGSFDLILCGERATDGETGQVGPELGAMRDLPVMTYVSKTEEITHAYIICRRLVEEGYQRVKVLLPALLPIVIRAQQEISRLTRTKKMESTD
ncbi:MAG: hypothetical protein QXQ66_06930 [Candidatus Hadarchaeum sp.]|uniref:electron transfer flavoprotein subunit beta/FixA family protein n=1 Tax=Candidatus Hadarchaeum sp. TaxID=2883567 RepID=UPI00317FEE68